MSSILPHAKLSRLGGKLNPLPNQMVDRWQYRVEPMADEKYLYWHILLDRYPNIQATASMAQEKLAAFTGLHFTPLPWLHITIFALGLDKEFTPGQIVDMTAKARQLLSTVAPVKITLSKVLYHSEAIVLKVDPDGVLHPIREVIKEAISGSMGRNGPTANMLWNPHITLAYSTTTQLAAPIIAALGREVPTCESSIDSVSLIAQKGAERLWAWQQLVDIPLAHLGV